MEPLDYHYYFPSSGSCYIGVGSRIRRLLLFMSVKDFFQQFDLTFGMYQFVLRSDESNRYNSFFTTLRHHAAMMMLLMVNGESPTNQLDVRTSLFIFS